MILKRENVQHCLTRDVENAHEHYKAEAATFNDVVHDLPGSIPYPDSITRISLAAAAHNDALHQYQAALSRLNDYTLHGIIPIDLRDDNE